MKNDRSLAAEFDVHDHAIKEGWASYHRKPMFRWRLRCRLNRHVWPRRPRTTNGYSPSNCGRCTRCGAFLGWFVPGQHRYGSYDRETARSYGLLPQR